MQSIDLGGFGIVGGHIVRQPTNCTVAFTAAGRGLAYSSPYTQKDLAERSAPCSVQ